MEGREGVWREGRDGKGRSARERERKGELESIG